MLIQSETEGGSRVRMKRLVPFDACNSLSEMQSKYALSSTCQARLTTVNGTIRCSRVPGGPGSGPLKSRVTRWRVRVRPPEFGGCPFVAGPRRVALLAQMHMRMFVPPCILWCCMQRRRECPSSLLLVITEHSGRSLFRRTLLYCLPCTLPRAGFGAPSIFPFFLGEMIPFRA